MAEVKADVVGDEVEKALDAAGRSTQLPEDAWDYDKTGAQEPPYNLEALAYFLEVNTFHFRCVPPGSLILMDAGDERLIEDVKEGDQVIAADGRTHVVLEKMCREHSGRLIEISVEGSNLPLHVTPEHPVYLLSHTALACPRRKGVFCKPGKKDFDAKCRGCEGGGLPDGQYVAALEVSRGDWVALPMRSRSQEQSVMVGRWRLDTSLVEFLGWYLAEGSVYVRKKGQSQRYRDVRVSLCFGSYEEELVARARLRLEEYFDLSGCIHTDRKKHTTQLIIMSPRVGSAVVELCGKGCEGKRLHPELMKHISAPLAMSLLRAYFEGDGHRRNPQKTGERTKSAVTVSRKLARQVKSLLEDLGYAPLYRETRFSCSSRKTRHEVFLTGDDVDRFEAGVPGTRCNRYKNVFWAEGKMFRRVRAVTHIPYRGPVYNLEVDGDPSYVADSVLVHNCCKAKAITTAGLGFRFVSPEGVEKGKEEHLKVLQNFFTHPNEEMTWGEILENVLTDYEALGNGYFEVVRNRLGTGPPKAIYHVPAVTMRVRKDKKGYIQKRNGRMVYFRNFGSDPEDPTSFDPRDANKSENERRRLNEIIHLKNYHPRSSYYGLPDFLPAFRALVGNKQAGDFNIQFFENNAVPQYAIIVKGGELAKGTRRRIEEYFRTHIKGQAHKTLILEVVQDGDEKVEVEIKPLSVDIKDSSFRMFRGDNAEEIRVAHGVPGRLIGLTEKGGLGGAGEGTTQQEIFKYHVIQPKQSRLVYRINNFLIKQGFGIDDLEIQFTEIDIIDRGKVAEIVQKLVKLGVLTINEGRRQMGQKALKHAGANVPFMMTSTGPLSLDVLAKGGVWPQNMSPPESPREGKSLIESLVTLRKQLRSEILKREAS